MLKRIYSLLLAFSIVLSSIVVIEAAETPADPFAGKDEINIVFIGGSITEGYGASTYQAFNYTTDRDGTIKNPNCYAGLVGQYLIDKYSDKDVNVYNVGVSGSGSGYAKVRFTENVIKYNPDMVFIEFAINDKYDPQESVMNLDILVRRLMELENPPIINFIYATDVNYGGIGEYQEKVAKYYGIPSHDIQAQFKKLMQQGRYESLYKLIGDGTHPNDAGYEIYADVIINNLKKRDGSYFVKPTEKERPYSKAVMMRPRFIEAKYAKREGAWSPEEFRGKAGYSSYQPGSTVTIDFYGPMLAIEYSVFSNGNQQRISVEVDGKSYGSTSMYGGSMGAYTVTGLTNEKHTAKVTVLGGDDPGFKFSGFYVDDADNPDKDTFYGEEKQEEEIHVDATAREIYVSLDGHDANDGTIDSPLKTLDQAKRAAAQLSQVADSDIKVIIRGGVYDVGEGLIFNKEDSGKKDSKIIFMPYEDEDVKLTNSKQLPNKQFNLVKDEATLNRIPKIARGRVYELDLKSAGIDDPGSIVKFGMHGKGAGSRMLTVNGRKYTIARWPNEDYANVKEVMPNVSGGHQFTFAENKDSWKTATEPWVAGYFTWLWADDALSIKSINTETNTIITSGTHAYGVKKDAPFYVFNLLEELDVPGEWFVDSSTMKMYVYPIEDDLNGDMRFTTMATPLVTVNKASYIELRNLKLEETTDYGISINEGNNITIDGCQLANIGRIGINMTGKNLLVQNCYLRDLGKGGIYIVNSTHTLKDGETFEHNNNLIYNNRIERFSLDSRTYACGISIGDRGGHSLHNTLNNANHTAIGSGGTDNIHESNDIYNVLKYANDMGAYYVGRTWTAGGNVIKYNYFHDSKGRDLRDNDLWFTQGLYFDDGKAGDTIIGNTFESLNRGIFLHFGKVMHMENNVFMDCPAGIRISGQSGASEESVLNSDKLIHDYYNETDGEYASQMPDNLRVSHAEYLKHKEMYDAKFPWIEKLFDRYILGPVDNKVIDNIFIGADKAIDLNGEYIERETEVRGNVEYPAGTTYEEARQLSGYTHIPSQEEAGIIVDEKMQIGEFRAVYPENGINEVDPKNLVLYWENSDGANKYRLIVAEDADFENVIYDHVLDENFKVFKSLKYNRQKYYWKVYAMSTGNAFTEDWHENINGVMTFRTLLEEEYLTENLVSVLKDSETILTHPRTIEGEEPGMYMFGSKESLKTSVEKAKEEMRLAGPISPFISKQMLINNLTDTMYNKYLSFTNSLNPTTVDISEILKDKDGWVGKDSGLMVNANQATFSKEATGFGYQGKILENYKRFKMKATIDVGSSWVSLCLRKPTNLTSSVWSSAGYCFLVKKDVLELQRFGGGDTYFYSVPNDCIEPGKEVLLEFGAVDTPQGVHITVSVDGVEKFNQYDNTTPIRNPGYFQVYLANNTAKVTLKSAN